MGKLLHAITLLLISVAAGAQPANDDCEDAIEIVDLDGDCINQPFTGATYDNDVNTNGSCADPVDAPNIWFRFTAQGMEVDLGFFGNGDAAEVSLGYFDGPNCEPGNYQELQAACTGNLLEYDNLTPGEEYFIIVTFENSAGAGVRLCVDNPVDGTPPPNDDPCDATTINPNGTWYDGTTENANPLEVNGNMITLPGCAAAGESVVFYNFTLNAGQNSFEVNIQDAGGMEDVNVGIVFFDPNCNVEPTYVDPTYCGDINGFTPLDFDCVDPGQEYYIWVSSPEDEEGDFEIQVTGSGPPTGCSESDECIDAIDVSVVSGEPPNCISGCNEGACPDIQGSGCFDNTGLAGVWYEFTTDNDATNLNVGVTSDDINNIQVAVYSGDCNNPTGLACQNGNMGEASIIQQAISPNTTYYVLVSSPPGQAGDFELCIGTTTDVSSCVLDSELEVIATSEGSPPTGPFKPGEEVTFRYEINEYTAQNNGCQWLQSIVPIFGNGWDPGSFQPNGRPVNAVDPTGQYGASWGWYDENAVTYKWDSPFYTIFQDPISGRKKICSYLDPNCANTGVVGGEGMPAGWYAYTNGGSPCCQPNGNPNDGWGDGAGCGVMSGWVVEFTLTARQFAGPEGCDETGHVDLSVQVFTFSDGEVGCYSCSPNSNSGVCAQDFPSFVSRTNQCCEGPMVMGDGREICSGGNTNISLSSDQDGEYDVTYSWTVTAPPNIIGASNGSGKAINQTLENTGTAPETVIYSVTGTNELNCLGDPLEILVTVFPEVQADAYSGPEPIEGCAGASEIELGGSPTGAGGGGPPYSYEWNNGLPPEANPTVMPNTSTTYRVTVTDANGCTGTDEISVEIAPAVLFEIVGDTVLCAENAPSELLFDPLTGTAPYDVDWVGPGGTNSGNTFDLEQSGNYEVIVTDANGCTGSESFQATVHSTPDILFTNIDGLDTLCEFEGPYLFLGTGFSDGNSLSYSWSTPSGPQSGETVEVFEGGTHILTVTDNLGCMGVDSFFVPSAPQPEPEILGTNKICIGATESLMVTDTFQNYAWSTGDSTSEISIDGPGTYSLTVTGTGGCEGATSLEVMRETSSVADAGMDQSLNCATDSVQLDGTASSMGPDFNASWSTQNGYFLSGANTFEPWVNEPGEYVLAVTNFSTSCTAYDTVIVTMDTLSPIADAGPEGSLTCENTIFVARGAPTASQNATPVWSALQGTFQGDPFADSIIVTSAGVFVVEVTDSLNHCVATDTLHVEARDSIPIAEAGFDGVLDCAEPIFQADASASSSGDHIAYEWTTNDGVIENGADGLQPQFSAEGTYQLEVRDTVTQCFQQDSLSVVDLRQSPEVELPDSLTLSCTNDSLMLDPNYERPDLYAVVWQDEDGNAISSELTLTVDLPGLYQLLVTDSTNHCDTVLSINIGADQAPPFADAGADAEIGCNQSSVVLDGTQSEQGAGLNYLWSAEDGGNILNGANGLQPEVSSGGRYILRVENTVNGCIARDTAIVTIQDGKPQLLAGPDPTLNCDSATVQIAAEVLSPASDFTFEWTSQNGNIVSGENSLSPRVDQAGSYQLQVTDSTNQCSSEIIISVDIDTLSPQVFSPFEDTLNCRASSILIDSEGADTGNEFSVQWTTTNGNILGSADEREIEVDQPGTYVFQIFNNLNGCENISSVEVIEDRELPTIAIAAPDTLSCLIEEIQLDASASSSGPGYSYSWTSTDGNLLDGADSIVALVDQAGLYRLEIVNERNGCESSSDVRVMQDTVAPIIQFEDPDPLNCSRDSSEIVASGSQGGDDFEWSRAGNIIAEGVGLDRIAVDQPGTYVLRYSNSLNGCSALDSTTVDAYFETPVLSLPDQQTLSCDTNVVSIDAEIEHSGGPLEILWTTASGNILSDPTESRLEADAPGWYVIRVEDQVSRCVAIDSVEIVLDEDLPVIDIAAVDTLNCLVSRIDLDASASTINGPAEYRWLALDSGRIVSDPSEAIVEIDAPGTYRLVLTDLRNQCSSNAEVTVVQDISTPEVVIEEPEQLNCEIEEILLDARGSSTGGIYGYNWESMNGDILQGNTTLQPTIGSPGIYELEVRNQRNGCTSRAQVEVKGVFDPPTIEFPDTVRLDCRQPRAEVEVIVRDISNYSIRWDASDGTIDTVLSNERVVVGRRGWVEVEVTDSANFCTTIDRLVIEEDFRTPELQLSSNGDLSCLNEEIRISALSGDSSDLSFQWSRAGAVLSGESAGTLLVDSPALYQLQVTHDRNGCIAVDSIRIEESENDFSDFTFVASDPVCPGNERGCIQIDSIFGGEAPYQLSLNENLFTGIDGIQCNVPVGENAITLRDANGCELTKEFAIGPAPDHLLEVAGNFVIQLGDELQLEMVTSIPDSSMGRISWLIEDSLYCSGCTFLEITPSVEGSLEGVVEVEFLDGQCTLRQDFRLQIIDERQVYIPNVFTPDGDGRNDFFTIHGNHKIRQIDHFQIFDRWGTRLWERKNFQPNIDQLGWDGTHRGEVVRPGVYVYSALVEYANGETEHLQGTITLMR